jgi:hypothetical protein
MVSAGFLVVLVRLVSTCGKQVRLVLPGGKWNSFVIVPLFSPTWDP